MNNRQARKILTCCKLSKRLTRKLDKLYPAYFNERGNWCQPSVSGYYRFKTAGNIVRRKINKYKEKFKML